MKTLCVVAVVFILGFACGSWFRPSDSGDCIEAKVNYNNAVYAVNYSKRNFVGDVIMNADLQREAETFQIYKHECHFQ